jgi:hypothetical protein
MVWLAIIFVSLTLAVSIIGGHYVLTAADRRERGLPDHWAIKWFIRVSFVVVFVNGVRACIWLVFGYRLF